MTIKKKYEFTGKTCDNGTGFTMHEIRALKDFDDVKAGDLGGYIESEKNLSQCGNCWVYPNSVVWANARVTGNAKVRGNSRVRNSAKVYENAVVDNDSDILTGAKIHGNAVVSNVMVDRSEIYGNAVVRGVGDCYGCITNYIDDKTHRFAYTIICDNAVIKLGRYEMFMGTAKDNDHIIVSKEYKNYNDAVKAINGL